jgi:hypothetical protein
VVLGGLFASSVVVAIAACGRFEFDPRGSDGAGPDAPGGGADAAACLGTTHLVTDDFDDGVRGAIWMSFADAGTSWVEQGGRLGVTLADNLGGERWVGYETASAYDLRDDRVFVEVPVVPDPARLGQALLGAEQAVTGDMLTLEYQEGSLLAARNVGGSWIELGRTGHDPVATRFWQLRHRAGALAWETSPDGIAWTSFHVGPPVLDLSAVRIIVSGGTASAQPMPGEAEFDNFNGGGAPPACP